MCGGGGSKPKPQPREAEAPVPPSYESGLSANQNASRRRKSQAAGGTVLTGAQGVTGAATTEQKTVLGA